MVGAYIITYKSLSFERFFVLEYTFVYIQIVLSENVRFYQFKLLLIVVNNVFYYKNVNFSLKA